MPVRSAMRPPAAIASRALTTRFITTCSICPRSALTWASDGARSVSSRTFSPIIRRSIRSRSTTTPLTSMTAGWMICRRLKASSWLVRAAARSAARRISSMSSRFGSSGPSCSATMSPYPRMAVSRLLKSWATPPASRPIASILTECRNCASREIRSVMSVMNPSRAIVSPPAPRIARPCSQTHFVSPLFVSMRYSIWKGRSASTLSCTVSQTIGRSSGWMRSPYPIPPSSTSSAVS